MAHRLARMSPDARAWYLAEIAFIAERNPVAAEKIAARFRAARQNLADHPKIGPTGLIPGTRRLVVGPYVLTVRQHGGIVEIAAIRHAKQSDAYAPKEMSQDLAAEDSPIDPPTDTSMKAR